VQEEEVSMSSSFGNYIWIYVNLNDPNSTSLSISKPAPTRKGKLLQTSTEGYGSQKVLLRIQVVACELTEI
jgi:hypothetical protein